MVDQIVVFTNIYMGLSPYYIIFTYHARQQDYVISLGVSMFIYMCVCKKKHFVITRIRYLIVVTDFFPKTN